MNKDPIRETDTSFIIPLVKKALGFGVGLYNEALEAPSLKRGFKITL